jgi:AcrR family transcriptional regulator
VAAAERLFAEGGEEATSLRAVTRAAISNAAAVHYHFGGRDGLLRAVLDRHLAGRQQRRCGLLDKAVDQYGGHVPVEAVVTAVVRPDLDLLAKLRKNRGVSTWRGSWAGRPRCAHPWWPTTRPPVRRTGRARGAAADRGPLGTDPANRRDSGCACCSTGLSMLYARAADGTSRGRSASTRWRAGAAAGGVRCRRHRAPLPEARGLTPYPWTPVPKKAKRRKD